MQTPEDFLRDGGFVAASEIDRDALIAAFVSEMDKGLAGKPSSLPMIPSYIGVDGKVPQGAKVAVLDAGGTNFRSGVVTIPPKVEERVNQPMPGVKSEVGVDEFYSAFANEVRRVKPLATVDKIGFCFSYPADATADLDARLIRWTKGIKAPAIVGQFVGKELLSRLGGGTIAIVNDTVATLLAAKATEGDREYSSYLGFILGTGTNTAYVERNENILKLSGLDPAGKMIINAESGSFSKIARSRFDLAMDAKTQTPGSNPFEKMIAGAYLGTIGLEIFKAAAKEGFFSKDAVGRLSGLSTLETIDLDNFAAGFKKAGRENPLDAIFADATDARLARRLALPVFERAAVLTAIHLAAFVIKTGEGISASSPVAINADGSTWYKTKAVPFADLVRRELDDILVKRRNIHYEITPQVEDAPMVGAGIAAML
ncbi:MAG: hexokinase [Kiritimatiellae bacterium]|nr:hexokinase [Kiritimatiellia bacterium]